MTAPENPLTLEELRLAMVTAQKAALVATGKYTSALVDYRLVDTALRGAGITSTHVDDSMKKFLGIGSKERRHDSG